MLVDNSGVEAVLVVHSTSFFVVAVGLRDGRNMTGACEAQHFG